MRLRLRRSSEDAARLPDTRAESLTVALRGNLDPDLAGLFGGGGVSPDQIGTVDRCLQLTAQQIATMPLRYKHADYAYEDQPRWVSDPDPAWYPNGIRDVVFSAVWSIYARGECFLWVTSRYVNGYPATFTVLDPTTMKVENDRGQRAFESNGYPLNADDVIQVQRDPNGALHGRSPLDAYSSNVQSAWLAETYAADVYRSTGATRVALKSTQRRPSQEEAEQLQADWVSAVSRRLGAPAVLPPDIDLLQTLTVSPKELMLLESREWDARQIAAAFGVPAMLLNIAISGSLVYQSPVQLFDLWWRSELMPSAVKFQEALSRWLPRGHWVEFDPASSLKPDLMAQVNIYSKALADGAVSVDEYRAGVFDLPPLATQGDKAESMLLEPGAHVGANGNGVLTIPDDLQVEVD